MRLNWFVRSFSPSNGYGRYASYFVRELASRDVGLSLYPAALLDWPGWLQRRTPLDFHDLSLYCGSVEDFDGGVPGRLIVSSMYETTQIPDEWVEKINQHAERVIVPTAWGADVFRASGVWDTIPIHVVPGGIDPVEFPYIVRHRSPDAPYVFMCDGNGGNRKGYDLAYQAFFKAFGQRDDVRLIIKARRDATGFNPFNRGGADRRLTLWREDVSDLRDVYALADCYLFPSRGEGWGLPPREAASTGLPVIATNWSGLSEGIEHWAYPINRFTLRRSLLDAGDWAEPDVDELASLMTFVVEHKEEAAAFGQQASRWLADCQNWGQSADILYDLLKEVTT